MSPGTSSRRVISLGSARSMKKHSIHGRSSAASAKRRRQSAIRPDRGRPRHRHATPARHRPLGARVAKRKGPGSRRHPSACCAAGNNSPRTRVTLPLFSSLRIAASQRFGTAASRRLEARSAGSRQAAGDSGAFCRRAASRPCLSGLPVTIIRTRTQRVRPEQPTQPA